MMNNESKIFSNEEFGTIRTMMIDNEIMFVGNDIVRALGYKSPRSFIDYHVDRKDRKVIPQSMSCGIKIPTRGLTFVNESGLYSIISSSDKPKTKKFQEWISKEVLPAIRNNNNYITPEALEKALLNPDFIIRLATSLKEEMAKNEALQIENTNLKAENEIMQPKAKYFDELVDDSLLTNFRDTARELGIGQKAFISFLEEENYIYRDKKRKILPNQQKNDGLFKLKEWYNRKSGLKGSQTFITPKGRETFRRICKDLISN